MANNSSTFTLGIKTKVDSAELAKLKIQLQEIQQLGKNLDFTKGRLQADEISQMITAARQLDQALTAAFDVDLNTVNIQKFNDYLRKSNLNLNDIQTGLAKAGVEGQAAFAKATSQLLKFNTVAKQSNHFLDKMAETMGNTVKWGVTSSIFNNIVGSVQKAYYYIEDLNTSINDIQIVTGKSADEMARFAEQANNAAKALATTTTDYTQGALIYYQQGLDDKTVKTLTDITAKTSNVTGQSMQSVSEQLTAVWNGYQVANEAAAEGMQVYEEYVDKMAAVGAATASDLEELATAMSKVASAANAMGVDFDQLSAQIATIVSVTRQAPESVGTALKTIYARIGDLKMDGVDEFGVTLGEVSGQLEQVGIQIMDQSGNMRDVGVVMEEVAAKWGTWNEAQQQSIAIAIAGKRQYNNLLALFENWDMYTDTLETAANAAGTLDKQQSVALESLENKLEKLSATAEDLYDSLFDEESLKDLVDSIIPLVQGFADIADAIGGLNNLLPMLGSIGMQVFSKQLANGLSTFKHNLLLSTNGINGQNQAIKELSQSYKELDFTNAEGNIDSEYGAAMKDMITYAEKMVDVRHLMTEEEEKIYNQILDEKAEVIKLTAALSEQKDIYKGSKSQALFGDNVDIKQVNKYNIAMTQLINKIKDLRNSQGVILNGKDKEVKQAQDAVIEFTNSLKNMGLQKEEVDELSFSLKTLISTTTKKGNLSKKTLDEIITILEKYPDGAEKVAELTYALKQSSEAAKDSGKKFKDNMDFKQAIDNISRVVGAIGQLASAIGTFVNIGDIINDKDLTSGEKFHQILLNLTYVIPSLLTALLSLSSVLGITTMLEKGATLAEIKAMLAKKAHTVVTKLLTAATVELGIASKGLTLPLWAIVAIIGAIIGVIALATKAYNKNAEALENAKEKAEEMKTALQEVKDAYQETVDTISNYQSARDAINNLTEGTVEWKKAITEANGEVLKLLENYPELVNYITKNKDGLLEIDEAAFDKILEDQYQKVQKANQEYIVSQMNVKYAERTVTQEEFERKYNIDYDKFTDAVSEGLTDAVDTGEELKAVYEDSLKQAGKTENQINKLLSEGSNFTTDLQNLSVSLDNNTQALLLLQDEYVESFLQSELQGSELARYELSQFKDVVNTLVAEGAMIRYKELQQTKSAEQEFNNAMMQSVAYSDNPQAAQAGQYLAQLFNSWIRPDNYKTDEEQLEQAYKENASVDEYLDKLEEIYVNTAKGALSSLDDQGDMASEVGQAIVNSLVDKNALSSLTQEQVDVLKEGLQSEESFVELTGLNDEDWDNLATSEGFESRADMLNYLTKSYDAETAAKERAAKAEAQFNKVISEGAKELEVNANALENYANHLIETNDELEENEEAAAQAAIANVKFAKGVEELREVLEDNINILETWDEEAFETYEAVGLIQDALEKVFGVKVSANFVKENLTDIKALAEGNTDALAELELAAAKDYVIGLNLKDGTDEINQILDDLANKNIEIGANVSLGDSVERINELLAAGTITADQIQNAFSAINYHPDVQWTTIPNPNPPESNYETSIEWNGVSLGTVKTTTKNTSAISVPYIADKNTASTGAKDTGYGAKNAGAGVTKISSSTSKAGALSKTLGDSKIGSDKKKEYLDEFDRYWDISKAIDAVTDSLEDLEKIQDRVFGKELIQVLEKENNLLDDQINKHRTLYEMQVKEAGELQWTLGQFGASFSSDGSLQNYATITKNMLAAVNSGSISEEQYDKFKKSLDRYDELFYKEMVDTKNQLDDFYYQQLSNSLEAWEIEIELNLETAEAEREWSDFLKEINDDFKATYQDIGKEFANIFEHLDTYSRSGGTIATNIQALKDVQDAIATMQAGGSSDMFASISEAEEKAKELKETLMEDVESVHGLWVNAWDAYMEGIDQASSKFDDLMSKFETIDEELEYQGELIELLYGTKAYELMNSLYDAQVANSLVQVDSLKQQANMWKELYDNAEEGSEEQTKYYEKWQEAQSNLNDAVVEHINLLKKDYSNTLDNILNKLEKDMTGGLGLDEMRESWEEATAAAEKYYDATERIYELETLESKFQEAIDNTSSLENQQKLKALMDDQLADLEAKEKLTEYDITLAEKRLAIAQAEMALEDAQNAKNSMKLVRGANGNWEYQYVADEDDIATKQQEMLDAYQNLYDYVKETQQESIESILSMTEQFFTKMNQIRNDDSLNEEQKMLKMEELRNQYYGENGKITILQTEHAKYVEDLNIANAELLWGLYKTDETNYGLMTEAQKVLIDDFINHSIEDYYTLNQYVTDTYDELQGKLEESTSESLVTWNSAAAEMANAWNADDGISIKSQVNEAFEEMQNALEEYETGIQILENTAGISFNNIIIDIENAIDATNELKNVTEELCDNSIIILNDYKSKINEIESAWYAVRDAVNAAMAAAGKAQNTSSENNFNPTITPTNSGGSGTGGNGSSGSNSGGGAPSENSEIAEEKQDTTPTASTTQNTGPLEPGDKIKSYENSSEDKGLVSGWMRTFTRDKNDNFTMSLVPYKATGLTGRIIEDGPIRDRVMPYNYYKVENVPWWFRESQLVRYDTGGYTGEWDSSGRVAMLHQKELVLNADDTENILEVVQLTRDMASLTSSVGSAVMDGVKMMLYDLMGMKAPGNNMVVTPQVTDGDNVFNITAEFPNANDVISIQEAILSLPNIASQYLSQNKK